MAQDDSKASAGHCSREILGFGGVGDFDEPDDFGAGGDFAGDDDEYGSFHDGDHRFSSASFQAIPSFDPETGRVSSGSTKASQHRLMPKPSFSQATVLLDAIASGDISTSQPNNPYEYFNSQALANLSTGNLWAGADHWKKMSKPRKAVKSGTKTGNDDAASSAKMPVKKKKTRKGKTAASTNGHGTLVDITKPIENLKELLEKPKKTKKSTISKLQWTQAMQTKHNNEDNLLPMDAGLGVKELTTLFLRPTANLADMMNDTILRYGNVGTSNAPKVVGFGGVETWGGDDFGDDDGYGFDIGGGDEVEPEDFVVPDLEGVRKVEKIKVGYATVAKKVDVKRLKLDLWEELERTFQRREESNNSIPTDVDPLDLEITAAELNDRVGQVDSATVSFQQTVRDMQATQAQTDVTLPFYFICVLHLCNEKGMTLESSGLNDFLIYSP
jgi:condensin complex subunit 2